MICQVSATATMQQFYATNTGVQLKELTAAVSQAAVNSALTTFVFISFRVVVFKICVAKILLIFVYL